MALRMRAISSSDLAKVADGITSPVSLCWKTVIGTPQARWREITQSGLASIMPRRRFWPVGGTNSVSPIAFSAQLAQGLVAALRPPSRSGLSMAMNHCGVLRKMTGFLERQECGYWCLRRPRAISALASTSALMTASLASPLAPLSSMTRLPSKPGASLVKRPSPSTVKGMVVIDAALPQPRRVFHPDVEVLAAVAGRGVHEAGAVLVGDMIAG